MTRRHRQHVRPLWLGLLAATRVPLLRFGPWVAFVLIAACPPAHVRAGAPSVAHVAACGLEFDLPAGYKITRPKRMVDAREGASCSFDIVKAKPEPHWHDCKDKEEGGEPPYDVCDWTLDDEPSPNVQVARVRPGGGPLVDAFERDDAGQWVVSNAQADPKPAEAIDFHGMPAWKGEKIVRLYWHRTRVKDFNGKYGGTGGADVTLVQFAPDLFVQLQAPPLDENYECVPFCSSLRLGARAQDLP